MARPVPTAKFLETRIAKPFPPMSHRLKTVRGRLPLSGRGPDSGHFAAEGKNSDITRDDGGIPGRADGRCGNRAQSPATTRTTSREGHEDLFRHGFGMRRSFVAANLLRDSRHSADRHK
jgi:hypothetical protein